MSDYVTGDNMKHVGPNSVSVQFITKVYITLYYPSIIVSDCVTGDYMKHVGPKHVSVQLITKVYRTYNSLQWCKDHCQMYRYYPSIREDT